MITSRKGKFYRDLDGYWATQKRYAENRSYSINLEKWLPSDRTASSVTYDLFGPTLTNVSLSGASETTATVAVSLDFGEFGLFVLPARTFILAANSTSTDLWWNRDTVEDFNNSSDSGAIIFVPTSPTKFDSDTGTVTVESMAGRTLTANRLDTIIHNPTGVPTTISHPASVAGTTASETSLDFTASGAGTVVFTFTLDDGSTIELPLRFYSVD